MEEILNEAWQSNQEAIPLAILAQGIVSQVSIAAAAYIRDSERHRFVSLGPQIQVCLLALENQLQIWIVLLALVLWVFLSGCCCGCGLARSSRFLTVQVSALSEPVPGATARLRGYSLQNRS
eukprot:2062499-Amphidinium_carterae.8